MEILINKFTNKYICFYSLFKVRGALNKGQILKNHCNGIYWIAKCLGSEGKICMKNTSVALQSFS